MQKKTEGKRKNQSEKQSGFGIDFLSVAESYERNGRLWRKTELC